MKDLLTDIAGVRVGHADDAALASGVTAVMFDKPAVAAIEPAQDGRIYIELVNGAFPQGRRHTPPDEPLVERGFLVSRFQIRCIQIRTAPGSCVALYRLGRNKLDEEIIGICATPPGPQWRGPAPCPSELQKDSFDTAASPVPPRIRASSNALQ